MKAKYTSFDLEIVASYITCRHLNSRFKHQCKYAIPLSAFELFKFKWYSEGEIGIPKFLSNICLKDFSFHLST